MKAVTRLKHAFLIAVGVSFFAIAQDKKNPQITQRVTPSENVQQPVQQHSFDYAFGDQAAAAFDLPGATGKGWMIKSSLEGLESFLKKNPNALKGKNVIAVVSDCTLGDVVLRKNKLSKMLLNAVGDGHIVLMGASERRTDGLGPFGNKQIKKFIADHQDVVIYGGPIMPAASAGEKLDPARDYIYPETAEEFAAIVKQANEALNTALKNQKQAKLALGMKW